MTSREPVYKTLEYENYYGRAPRELLSLLYLRVYDGEINIAHSHGNKIFMHSDGYTVRPY